MEVLSFAKELLQGAVEHAVSYRLGQTCLRYVDKVLWTIEKCARWAVPPPLDQDERHRPELVRPLPWVFFLMLLVALRVTRESISLINLAFGKPPFRSADMVSYIQSKRRYLRTLKYQGNRMMRARSDTPSDSWRSSLCALFQFTMCFRRPHYANNNTTQMSNNDEVLVVRRSKRGRQASSAAATASDASMERLIEKMLVDLDADSDESSSYTLTNAASIKSDRSDCSESDQEFSKTYISADTNNRAIIHTSTPEKGRENNELVRDENRSQTETREDMRSQVEAREDMWGQVETREDTRRQVETREETRSQVETREDKRSQVETILNFIQSERNGQSNHKIVNGTSRHTSPAKERIQDGELIY